MALRFFNVYGPGQALSNPYTGVAAIFGSRLLNGRPPVIFEDGEQSRDFIHVSDIVRGYLCSRWSPKADPGTRSTSVRGERARWSVAKALAAGMNLDLDPIRNSQYRAGDIRHCVADPHCVLELLGSRRPRP